MDISIAAYLDVEDFLLSQIYSYDSRLRAFLYNSLEDTRKESIKLITFLICFSNSFLAFAATVKIRHFGLEHSVSCVSVFLKNKIYGVGIHFPSSQFFCQHILPSVHLN